MPQRDDNPTTDAFPIPGEDNPWDREDGERYLRRRGSVGPVIIILFLVIIALALATAVWAWLSGDGQKDPEPSVVGAATSTVTSTAPSSSSSTSTTTSTSSSKSSTTKSTTSSTSSSASSSTRIEPTSSQRPETPPIAVGQPGQTQCGALGGQGIWSGNGQTSCGFATAVAHAAAGMPDTDVQQFKVRSPVTGQRYTMTCRGLGHGYVECTGGDQAQVIISGESR